jgi:hypothetical protein
MKADEYRYWQSRPVHERMDAVEEITLATYAMKGTELEPDAKTTKTSCPPSTPTALSI